MAKGKDRWVVVTTDKDRRGVFFGNLTKFNEDKATCVLTEARMAVYWCSDCHGVVGLASIGPQKGSRISPKIPKITLNGLSSVMDCTDEAIMQWEKGLW